MNEVQDKISTQVALEESDFEESINLSAIMRGCLTHADHFSFPLDENVLRKTKSELKTTVTPKLEKTVISIYKHTEMGEWLMMEALYV